MPFGPHRQRREACMRVAYGVGEAGDRRPAVAANLGQGKKAPLQHQKPIGGNAKRGVMMKSAPVAAFIMSEPEFLLQFLVVALDAPAQLAVATKWRRRMASGRFDSQYFAGSFSALGHSISSHC